MYKSTIFTRVVLQFRYVVSDIESMWINLLAKCDGTKVFYWTSNERCAGTLHPTAGGHTGFKVQQHFLKDLLPFHPALPEVTPCEKDGH